MGKARHTRKTRVEKVIQNYQWDKRHRIGGYGWMDKDYSLYRCKKFNTQKEALNATKDL